LKSTHLNIIGVIPNMSETLVTRHYHWWSILHL